MKKYTVLLLAMLLFITNIHAVKKDKLPTIQKAWIDTGFFIWNDSTKSSLCITEHGARQETLPNVSDGEQLTSAYYMFSQFRLTYDR